MDDEKEQIIELCKTFAKKADALENRAFGDNAYKENGFNKDFNALFDQFCFGIQNRTISGLNFRSPPRYDNLRFANETLVEELSKTKCQVTFWAEPKFRSLRFTLNKKMIIGD